MVAVKKKWEKNEPSKNMNIIQIDEDVWSLWNAVAISSAKQLWFNASGQIAVNSMSLCFIGFAAK